MHFKHFIGYIAILLLFTACSTSEKVTVSAPRGATLYWPSTRPIAAAENKRTGDRKIEIPSDMYCGYLLMSEPGSNLQIPIGLDYKKSRHTGTRAAFFTGTGLAAVGTGGLVLSTICYLLANSQDDEDGAEVFVPAMGISGAAALLGCGIGMPANARMNQTAYDYNFGYTNQQFEVPQLSAKLLHPNPPKNMPEQKEHDTQKPERKKAVSGKDVVPEATPATSNASASRSDFALKVAGKYVGSGTLKLGKVIDESYPEMQVIIERADRRQVKVKVIESDEEFFESALVYSVKKNNNGSFTLTIDNLPEATINISKDGKLTFNHSKVNIDNKIYTLSISAVKSK